VSHNCITEAGVRALAAIGVCLRADGQWQALGNPEDEEQAYLYEGHIE
jgi:hypothetical protein